MLQGSLNHLFLGLAQAGLAAVMSLAVMLLARRREIHVERETVVALVRGLAQIIAVGSVLIVLLRGPQWIGGLILALMMVLAAATSARRAKRIPGAFQASLVAIAVGAGLVVAIMVLSGIIARSITALVPVGSMLIAAAMNTNALALDRFRAEVQSHVGEIESALALGASPPAAVARFVQTSYRASLIPPLNNLRTLGIVWIPGLMTGMLLSGSPPLYAAIYQFVVIAMMFAASGVTCLISTTLIRQHAFTPGQQLLLRGS
jgi:putative ABC transport system permease protein